MLPHSTPPLQTRALLLSPVFHSLLYFLKNLECPVAAISLSHLPLLFLLYRPEFHLPLYPVASGKLMSSRPLLFNCLWPNKGDHIGTVHSSASSPANPAMLLGAPQPILLTSLSFCFSTENCNCIP